MNFFKFNVMVLYFENGYYLVYLYNWNLVFFGIWNKIKKGLEIL